MSAPYPFDTSPVAPHSNLPAKPRHPLGLPAASVRALLTLMIVGTVWGLLAMPAEKEISVPLYLYYLTFLAVGSYFGARGSSKPLPGQSHPLGLPRGSIRLLIILGFAGVIGWGIYQNPDFLEKLKTDPVAGQPFLPFIVFGAFFLGSVVSTIAHMTLAGPQGLPAWFQDIQAYVSLLSVLGLGVEVIYQLVIYPGLDPATAFQMPHWQSVLSGIVAFYYGARS